MTVLEISQVPRIGIYQREPPVLIALPDRTEETRRCSILAYLPVYATPE
jgi:hypothetical protein